MNKHTGPLSNLSKAQASARLKRDSEGIAVTIVASELTPSRMPAPDPRYKTQVELYGRSEGGLEFHETNGVI